MTTHVFKSGINYTALAQFYALGAVCYVNFLAGLSHGWLIVFGIIFFSVLFWAVLYELNQICIGDDGIRFGSRLMWYLLPRKGYHVQIKYSDMMRVELKNAVSFQGRQLLVTDKNNKLYVIYESGHADFDAFVKSLRQYVSIDQNMGRSLLWWSNAEKPVIHVMSFGLFLLGSGFLLDEMCKYFHLSLDETPKIFSLILVPLSVLGTFLYLREKEVRNAFLSPLLSGAFIGLGLTFVLININQLYTEYQGSTYLYQFEFVEQTGYIQTWKVPSVMKLDNYEFVVNKRWTQGFTQGFKPGHSYQISVKQGFLNDIAFAPDAFKNAQEVKAGSSY